MSNDPMVTAAERMDRLQKIAVAAEEFVRAHCALEALAAKLGVNAAASSPLNDRVVELHMQLEKLVLGDENVAGRRARWP